LISIIIPTINEISNIDQTILRIKNLISKIKIDHEIIFVDDKSTDGTIQKIQEHIKKNKKIKLIISNKRKGLGYALLQGVNLSSGKYILFLDADNSVQNKYLEKLIVNRNKNLLIIGSRYIKNSKIRGVSKIKIFFSKLLNILISKIFNLNATDISHSLRLFPSNFKILTKNYKHPSFFWEHSIKASRKNLKIIEIPISFDERKSGKTKNSFFKLFKSIIFSLKFLFMLKIK
tara:strand:- start:3238 stop:3933 length:696 start_codon:yes stop_codon:yes gene_type:complete